MASKPSPEDRGASGPRPSRRAEPAGPGAPALVLAVLVAIGAGLAALLAAGLVAVSSEQQAGLGLPEAGAPTRYGLPVVKVFADVAAALCIGFLWSAGFATAWGYGRALGADGRAAVRAAGWAAVVWFAGAATMAPLLAADAVGRPPGELVRTGVLVGLVGTLEQSRAWAATAVVALVVAAGCWTARSWGRTAWLLVLAMGGLLPIGVTGHSASSGAHDIATASLLQHLLAASLWVGGLVALLTHAARRGGHLAAATRRFSGLALVCWVALAGTGAVNALTRLPATELLSTAYGLLVLAKTAALLVLGLIGYLQRRRVVAAVAGGRPAALLRLGAVEVLLMLCTVGIAVSLGRTAPPALGGETTREELFLGFVVGGPPTPLRFAVDWRVDLVCAVLALAMAVAYGRGVRRVRAVGGRWPKGRTAAFACGCGVLLLTTSSGFARYLPSVPSALAGGLLLLAVVAPALLALGCPVRLLERTTIPGGALPGPREWGRAVWRTRTARFLTEPLVAAVVLVLGFFGLYFSGVLEAGLYEYWLQPVARVGFLCAGWLFYWSVLGVDPVPSEATAGSRVAAAFVAGGGLAAFGVSLTRTATPIGEQFYRGLELPWMPDVLVSQHTGGVLAVGAAGVLLAMSATVLLHGGEERGGAR
ncbi:bifunctional copper resistance protein CopD/cytochrome c oxidase assembly protein [Saccharopolyspora erythraea]|uniref:bifunctional copper resistance protein CopD/cytochrome c oxidase assembly protein n=1 Tax=Saccharopolyspora erythraea TaxID=1836 RepID=UPI00201373C0|nr:bifunctional copper resistance protein CopD/cytochrome c oxidase assembly protein [Saccharopolyspora erythraea]